MKIGLCAWSFTGAHREAGRALDPHTPEGLTRLAKDEGLHSVEFAAQWLGDCSPEERAVFAETRAGLNLFLDTGGDDYAADIAPLRQAIETAHQTGARAVRTTVSRLVEGDRTEYGAEGMRAYIKALVQPFKEVMPLAEEYGIPVGIENHQDLCSWELLSLCEKVGSPQLGVTMDVGNALAVGEHPRSFAERILPILKHVHLKDYAVHPTPSGYRLKRCAIGDGVVNWPEIIALFDRTVPQVEGCIELGASVARHIRLLEADWWATFPERPLDEAIHAIRTLHQAADDPDDWQTPHERGASAAVRVAYELEQFERSVAYVKKSLSPES